MSIVKRAILIIVVLVSCVGCDQVTKSIAVSVLPVDKPLSYLCDTVRLQLVYNRGAFLSMGSSLPEAWRVGIFTIGVSCLLLIVLIYVFLSKQQHSSLLLGGALLLAGGVGNLFDRVTRGGLVVDFLNVGIGPVRTGIFNIADIAITVGGLIFFWVILRQKQKGC
ncbi:MAG: signal peptidase II [Proteobacteria bacterium]|nr:signal peptidase II [Pseudomonadota bacterium]